MNKTWLILDCNFLCHRAKYSTGGLYYGETPTGIIYGFLRYLPILEDFFDTSNIVFCWDSKTSKREEIFPKYKANRKDKYRGMSTKQVRFEKAFRHQIKILRTEYLKTIGFKNVFCQKGYESDDLIASVCFNLPKRDEAIIVSSDHDLYQLIRHNISFYNPQKQKVLTLQGFSEQYEIIPELWITVKCVAGCSTDGVLGIKGIGEKTVIKYLTGELNEATKAHQKIKRGKTKYIKRNHPLVALPFEGTKIFKLREDELTEEGWHEVIEELGMKSIRDKMPLHKRRKKK